MTPSDSLKQSKDENKPSKDANKPGNLKEALDGFFKELLERPVTTEPENEREVNIIKPKEPSNLIKSETPSNLKELLDKCVVKKEVKNELEEQDLGGAKMFDDMECSTSGGGEAGKIKRRRFSSARVQPTRIKKVMQSDEEIGRMVASVPVAIGSAMEHFAERLLETAAQCVQFSNCRTLSPMHIRYAVMTQPHLAFLESLMKDIPLPKFSSDYLESQSHMLSTQLRSSLLDPTLVPSGSEVGTPPIMGMQFSPIMGNSNSNLSEDLKPFFNVNQMKQQAQGSEWVEEPPKRKRGRPRKADKERLIHDTSAETKPNLAVFQIPPPGFHPFSNDHDGGPTTPEQDRLLMPPPAILPVKSPRRSGDGQSPGVLLKPISLLTTNNGKLNTGNDNSNGEPAKIVTDIL